MVLVSLFENLYSVNKIHFDKIINNLILEFTRVWIPQTVKKEFIDNIHIKEKKKREKRFKRIQSQFPQIVICPIKVSNKEMEVLVASKTDNLGEADAILQIQKAKNNLTQDFYTFSDIVFLTSDKAAIRLANNLGIITRNFNEFKKQQREIGISIP